MSETRVPKPVVLVVDDEPPLVEIAARMLEPHGYEVLSAHSGPEAVALSRSTTRSLDLLLTDLHMPDMGGRELATALRNTHLGLKVLYLTAHSDDLFGTLTLLEPHEAFIEKPISPQGLREAVALHLFGTLTPPVHPDGAGQTAAPAARQGSVVPEEPAPRPPRRTDDTRTPPPR